jgi:hypothetical protein
MLGAHTLQGRDEQGASCRWKGAGAQLSGNALGHSLQIGLGFFEDCEDTFGVCNQLDARMRQADTSANALEEFDAGFSLEC